MENAEKVLGLQDFITNACNQDTTKKTKLTVLYNSYKNFTKEISMEPYSKKTFKEHINHLFKIKKDPESNNLLVTGIRPKEEQQTSFKLTPHEIEEAALEEARADMAVEKAKEVDKKHESTTPEEIIANVIEESVSETEEYINSLKKQRQFIDKKISIMYKLDNLKKTADTIFSTAIKNIENLKDSKDADEMTNKLAEAIKIMNSIKI